MKTEENSRQARRGSSLIMVFIMTFAISGVLFVSVNAAMQRSYMARRLTDRIKAKAIAETGVSHTYRDLCLDFGLRTNPAAFSVTPYAGGTYEVEVFPVGSEAAVIKSKGTYNEEEETVILDVRVFGGGLDEDGDLAYGYAVLADGEISWTGCGVFSGGSSVHGNSAFTQSGSGELNAQISSSESVRLNGNSGSIEGDVTAPEVSGKTSKITGTITQTSVGRVDLPELDLGPYYNEALANGQVYEGSQSLSHAFAPPGGIMWVNGDLTISGPEDITGCFIATGSIHCSGSGGHQKVAGYPAFISRDGNIKFSGSGSYEGLVYARIGDVEITGSGTFEGAIMCGGDFKKTGVSTVINYCESMPVPPNTLPTDGMLCVSAWQK